MASSYCNLVKLNIQGSVLSETPLLTWCTTTKGTQVFANSGSIRVDAKAPNAYCLLTVMRPNDAKQIKPEMAVLVQLRAAAGVKSTVSKQHVTFVFEGANVKDCSDVWQAQLNAKANNALQYFKQFVAANNIVLDHRHHVNEYCNPVMMEADIFLNGQYSAMSTLCGWPQCGRITVTHIHFMRSIVYACVLTQCNVALVAKQSTLTLENANVLISVCLTAFAGNYPETPELVDDRTCGELKLCTNRDCDDMAITVCGVFNSLKKQGKQKFTAMPTLVHTFGKKMTRVAELVLNFMLDTYKTALCVVCEAKPHLANPNIVNDADSNPIGHVFAVLTPSALPEVHNEGAACNDMLLNSIVLECTRASSPQCTALDTHTIDGQQVFCRSPVFDVAQKGVQCVKPFVARQYPFCMAAYSDKHTFLLADKHNIVGVPIQNLINGSAKSILVSHIPDNAKYCTVANNLCHNINYNTVDDVCKRYGWQSFLGLGNGRAVHTHDTQTSWTHLVNPALFETEALCITNCNACGLLNKP